MIKVNPSELFNKYYYLVDANVYALQRKGKYKNIDIEDQKQIAAISLWESSKKWKPGIIPFTAYVSQRIRFAISDESRKGRKIQYSEFPNDIIGLDLNENVFDRIWKCRILMSVTNFTERENEVIQLLMNNYNDRETSEKLDVTRQRITQIKLHIINKMKKKIINMKGFGI